MVQFTIIVPIYNEEDNLIRLVQELNAFVANSLVTSAVLFINDGSSDQSHKMISDLCKRHAHFSALHFDKNYGLSAALKAGFDHVSSPWLGYMDADLQTSPADFNLLLSKLPAYDLVTGVRSSRKDNFIKNISSVIANKIRRFFTQDGMDDTGCPLKVIKTSYAQRIPMFKGLHRFLPAMILLQEGKVLQVPVQHFPRLAGKSHFGVWNRLIGPLVDCFAYLWIRRKYIHYKIEDK